jgi:16S rRNA (guanine527-N7)-methyltransferase
MEELAQHVQRQLGVRLNKAQINALAYYERELIDWNARFNLTAIRSPQEIRIKHFLDSLTCLLAMRDTPMERLIDIGSGAGLPGIPLKIIYPKMQVTLVESVGKKADFCRHVIKMLDLTGMEVIQGGRNVGHLPRIGKLRLGSGAPWQSSGAGGIRCRWCAWAATCWR